jgi:hypothetical protein
VPLQDPAQVAGRQGAQRDGALAWRPATWVITPIAVTSRPQSTPPSSAPIWPTARASSSAWAARPASVAQISWRRASAGERRLVTRPSDSKRLSTRLRYPASMSRAWRSQDTSTVPCRAISYSSLLSVNV